MRISTRGDHGEFATCPPGVFRNSPGEPGHTRDTRGAVAPVVASVVSTSTGTHGSRELQAHHGHVALLNRPRAVPAMV